MNGNDLAPAPGSPMDDAAPATPVAFLADPTLSGHRQTSACEIARRIARLRRMPFLELTQPLRPMRCYAVPSATLVGVEVAGPLHLTSERDLFGGLVPHAVLAGKAIGHPLAAPDAPHPDGWAPAFAAAVGHVALRGMSAFDPASARRAGQDLLKGGPIRLKPAWADGGLGQTTIDSTATLDATLADLDPRGLAEHGLVLEEDIREACTFSVGQVRIGGTVLSYLGHQHTTADNVGGKAYGGSTLTVLRGPLDSLRQLQLDARMRRALDCAIVYDHAATAHLPGLVASRRNYDVICGWRLSGESCIGVLEQSWRLGGASGAEIAAFEAMEADPELAAVRAACTERYGSRTEPSAGSFVYFHDDDPELGPITKSATIEDRYTHLPPHILE